MGYSMPMNRPQIQYKEESTYEVRDDKISNNTVHVLSLKNHENLGVDNVVSLLVYLIFGRE